MSPVRVRSCPVVAIRATPKSRIFTWPPRQHHDVAGFDVPVHDALLMGVVQPVAHLSHDREPVFERQAVVADDLAQLPAVEQLHDDEEAPVVLAHLVDRHDVRMAQPGAGLGLAEEAGSLLGGGLDVARDDLDGN